MIIVVCSPTLFVYPLHSGMVRQDSLSFFATFVQLFFWAEKVFAISSRFISFSITLFFADEDVNIY